MIKKKVVQIKFQNNFNGNGAFFQELALYLIDETH